MLCGISIVNNPGLQTLQRLVRHVGGGNRSVRTGLSSRMSSCISQDDLVDDDARSVATSSHVSVSRSQVSQVLSSPTSVTRRTLKELSRESSKESSFSESDDVPQPTILKPKVSQSSMSSDASSLAGVANHRPPAVATESPPSARNNLNCLGQRSSTPPLAASPATVRRMRMVKSYSQDASLPPPNSCHMSSSQSDSALPSLLRVKGSPPTLDEVDESCSASDTGSITDLDGRKKKKSFFNFRRKKDKHPPAVS